MQATTTQVKLAPTVVVSESHAGDVMFDGRRARPVGAFKTDGTPVVCCVRTARKNGWTIAVRAFSRKYSA